ncbi:MAG: O-antigen ligase family protein, partial [Planctomycetia bacterium]|nr:O-antigen ligase family protein [Planctomycetia bacterium]
MTLLCCALAQSAFSLYSFAYATPRLQAAYRSDPEKVLKENGLVFQENSSERLLFEKRLLESTEPFGTYGLANTLAGFLSPVLLLVVMCAPVIIRQCRQREVAATYDINLTINPTLRVFILISYLLFIVLLFFILALTKSRAGVLSLFIGLVLWGVTFICAKLRQGGRLPQVGIKTIACGIGVVAVLTVGLFTTKTIDAEVFTQASKSLGYRMDYWRASSQIIKDFPIFGCGPGEFQSVYARYILPTASEFIADPHNFAFEIASVLGVPALIFF